LPLLTFSLATVGTDCRPARTLLKMASASKWSMGQLVNVKPRTWAGINRPGGVGKITKLHYSNGFVESLDVKYLVGSGNDAKLDLDFVEAYEPLEATGRSRRGRDLYTASPAKRGVSPDDADRPAKKAKKKSNANSKQSGDKVQKSKAVPKVGDENADPKKPKAVQRKLKPNKTDKKTATLSEVANKEQKRPPATHVIVKKNCPVSPLAITPAELRNQQKKSSKACSKKVSSKSRTLPSSAKPTAVTKSSSEAETQGFVIKKASRPTNSSSHKKIAPISLAAKCEQVAPMNEKKLPALKKKTQVQMNRVPLKRVYDAQVDRANSFVEGLVGKPKATGLLDVEEKDPAPAECAVTLSPPNTEQVYV